MSTLGFTKALINNIQRTFTYAYAKNAYGYSGAPSEYDPVAFFVKKLEEESPFDLFMELERYGYKAAKRDIEKYKIPYTKQQERRARVYGIYYLTYV